MHVAVDAHNVLTDRRGIGVYLRAVLRRMLASGECRITLLLRHPLPGLKKRALAAELGSEDFALASRVPRDAAVAWHPWNGTFFGGGRRNVVTMHDVAPFVYPAADRQKRRSQQAPFESSARTADRIIADSHFSKSGIESYLGVEPERITVVPLAADERFTPGKPEELPAPLRDRRYVLYVGTLEERKNVATLIAAWRNALAPRGIALAAVSGGDRLPDGVVALRDLAPGRFRDIYRGALCLAFPTLYEGFGLPALEAMACGTPAAVSRVASLPEVCGEAAWYVDEPQSVPAWEAALLDIASSEELRADLSRRGLEQAAKFSWDATARATLDALVEAGA
ncbi:MAG TPA: glycosyltransferase family 1 protein [Candidatus Rubrimentiphilum sp.]|nr:glycosyltransferase family 1 protein [Candidatus Rubrimentiphilum sp.]